MFTVIAYYLFGLILGVLVDSVISGESETTSGQIMESGYGGLGKFVVPHSYAARVTYKMSPEFRRQLYIST